MQVWPTCRAQAEESWVWECPRKQVTDKVTVNSLRLPLGIWLSLPSQCPRAESTPDPGISR